MSHSSKARIGAGSMALASLALALTAYGPAAKAQVAAVVSPADAPYGCYGDAVHDDTNCFQAALTASQGRELYLGPHQYLITRPLVITGPVHIRGVGTGWQTDSSSCLKVGVANLSSLITVTRAGGGSTFRDFCIQPMPGVVNRSGAAITINGDANSVKIENLWIAQPCIGIDVNGNSNTIGGSLTLISMVGGAGCMGIRVGAQTTRAATADVRIENTTVIGNQSSPPDENVLVLDAGGLYFAHDDFLYGNVGTKILPGANQQITWMYALDSALGDTTSNQGLYINTSDPTAQIKGLNFATTWTASTATGDEVYIGNSAGGKVADINFLHHRAYIAANNATGNGFTIGPNVSNVSINSSEICGYSGYGISMLAGAGGLMLTSSRVQPTCALLTGKGLYGVYFAGGNSNILINGNDFTGNNGNYGAIGGTPQSNAVITANLPGDVAAPTIAAAATVSLPSLNSYVYVSGATPIKMINGGFNGRVVHLIAINTPLAFQTGGNICNARTTSGVYDSVTAWYNGACWILK